MLSPKEVAAECGLQPRAIYKVIERGELPAYKLCGRLRIARADLDGWREASRVVPREPAKLPFSRVAAARNGLRRLVDTSEGIG